MKTLRNFLGFGLVFGLVVTGFLLMTSSDFITAVLGISIFYSVCDWVYRSDKKNDSRLQSNGTALHS